MNITQKQRILDIIEKISNFDLIGFLKSQGVEDLDNFLYGELKISDFKTDLERTLIQLKTEIESPNYRYLPNTFNSNTEFGNIDLFNDLNLLLSNIKVWGNEFSVISILDKLIFYQVNFGFWDKSSINVHDIRSIDIKRKLNDLSALEDKTLFQRAQIEKDLSEVKLIKTELQSDLDQLKDSLISINDKEQQSEVALTDVKRNLDESTTTKHQIVNIENQITESLNKISSDINDNAKKFNDITNHNNNLKLDLEKAINDSIEYNTQIKASHDYINSQKEQIEKMVGLATDGAIGYKFDNRQKNINNSVSFWKRAVPISYILAAIWVAIIFNAFEKNLSNEWLNLSINLVKTTPAWLLVAFCTNQYKKEREFEEEYAFKSAVAMTITSYTSLLNNDDLNEMKTKDKLLSKVLDDLYASPIKKDNHKKKLFSGKGKDNIDLISKAKDLETIIKPLIELTKEIKK